MIETVDGLTFTTTTTPALEAIIQRLGEREAAIEGAVATAARSAYESGADLFAAKAELRRIRRETGEIILFKEWIAHHFHPRTGGSSYWTANRYMHISRRWKRYGGPPALPLTALYQLSRPSVPDAALETLSALPNPTPEDAVTILESHEKGTKRLGMEAQRRTEMALAASADRVKTLAMQDNITSPEVITVLNRYHDEYPDDFDAIERDHLLRFEGERYQNRRPVPLSKVSPRAAEESFASHKREEKILEWTAVTPAPDIFTEATIVDTARAFHFQTRRERYTITVEIDEETYRRVLEKELKGKKKRVIIRDLGDRQ